MSYTLKRVILLPAVVLLSGLLLAGAEEKKEPGLKVKKGAQTVTVKGSLRNWSDADKTPLNVRNKPRRMRPVMNFERNLPLVKKTGQADPVVQDSHKPKGMQREMLMPAPLTSFNGMNQASNGAGWPPDTTGDVGPTYYIQGVNTSIGIYRKSDGGLVSATTFDDFFGGTGITGTPCDSDNNGDPIILYDQYAQRWFILDFAWTGTSNGSWFSIAVSKTSDPTGQWWQYAFHADNTLMNDYPKCGVWGDAIYITANMFQFSGSFQHSKVWALKKPDLYNGTLTAQSVTDSGELAFSLLPAHAKGTTAPPTGAPCYLYAQDADEYGTGHSDAINVWKWTIDWNNSANSTWTGPQTIAVAAYTILSSGVPQPSSSISLDSLYGRLMNPASYRNFGTHQSVYLCHVAEYSSRRAMRWYEVRISNGTSSIYQQGTYSPDSNHRWMGSVAADKNGNIAMGYSVSSSSVYPSVRYAGRLSTDTLGEMTQGEASMVAGAGSQSSYTRWGDYSSLSIDPDDDETFWYTQEYYSASGTNWNTRIGSFKVSGGTPPPTGLNNAVDYPDGTFTTSGNADWATDTSTYYYDNDSAKSGAISHSQSTSMALSVNFTVAKTVKFYWKVSSETNYDYLKFYIDGVEKDKISGTVDWTQKSYSMASGSHTLTWTYIKDGSVVSGSDCGWVDKLEFADGSVTDPIAVALDYSTLTFTLSGNQQWFATTTGAYYGGSCATVPAALSDSQQASMETSITGKTSVKFYWKVSSEANYDYLIFYIDGVEKAKISGTVAWTQKTFTVTSGSHTLKWVYSKDYSVSSGSDTAWVDKLELL